ncbi:RNA polymerase sigma-70 factor [Pedobacter nutrimenti]|jgi:RNA polymerase sigma-70 factor (ECF subfamily)|uniref:RNA polymerase sigma-70 factor (ECF subfamily) n=1 Tax=Pedobacter nutrimenti TaxID=1241337 RepID=A0A318UGG9_9SPHI|nr:RNA polymerase sigma-70 factor [Pedobacter nutrimenti]PYF75201.1 RNA polymerase sigma-70 factor (ECF subfamily) [Pedobacter nutrimenti]|eukprot:gene10552-12275_t
MAKTIEDLSDRLLLEKYSQGNTSAYNVLFKRYYDSLYRFALKNVKDSFAAEELTMDVMLGLWKKKGDIFVEDDLKAYLFRSVKNAVYNHYRKKLLPTVPLEIVRDEQLLSGKAADHELQSRELESVYRQKLEQLSPQRRRVYELSREQNMSYAEIAKDMDLSVNTVENYMVASLSFFRKQLKEHADYTLIFAFSLFFL